MSDQTRPGDQPEPDEEADAHIRALLAEPLDAARARLGIAEPTLYQEAHRAYRSRGIDPYNFLASQQAIAA